LIIQLGPKNFIVLQFILITGRIEMSGQCPDGSRKLDWKAGRRGVVYDPELIFIRIEYLQIQMIEGIIY
jgi:hypothetical protein